MAHVQITHGKSLGQLKLVVDGVDLSNHVYDGTVEFVKVGDEFGEWGVRFVLAADTLDVDLPHAAVQASERDDFTHEVAAAKECLVATMAELGAINAALRELEHLVEKGVRK